MSTVQEIKEAAAKLSTSELAELAEWLTEARQKNTRDDPPQREHWREQWRSLIGRTNAAVGPITWTRAEIHER